MAVARAEIWAKARALDPATRLGARGPRARTLASRIGPATSALAFRALAEAPTWIAWPAERRRRLRLIAGALAMSHRLQRVIEGRLLKTVADHIGDARLDAILDHPGVPNLAWDDDLSVETLERLGRSILATDQDQEVLRRLDPAPIEPVFGLDAETASVIQTLALAIEADAA
jgi:hypothetical protein